MYLNTIFQNLNMIKRASIFYCLLAITVGACQVRSDKKFDKIQWISGHWKASGEDTYFYESWERKEPALYTGKAYTLVGTDTVFSEKMTIAEEGGKIYLNTVPAEKEAVAFQLMGANDKEVIFENPMHDYPRRITYRRISADSLYVEITGIALGATQGQEIYFQRIR